MAPQDDLTAERAVSLEVRKALAEKVKGLLLNGLTHEENQIWLANVDAFENRAYQRGRQAALREAAKQTCMYCSGNARGYTIGVAGPNSAGNYMHEVPEDSWAKESVLCKATSIWALIYYEDRLASEGG